MALASKSAANRARALVRKARKSRTLAEVSKLTGVAERTLRAWLAGGVPRADLCERATKRLASRA